jgi:protein transport protein SEC24
MVATATRTIFESLERIPNADNLTKIAIIGFDTMLYFFSLTPETTECSMMVVSDIEDVFLPKQTDLLVNLTECCAGIESLLGRINEMFVQTASPGMGPALQAGFKLIVSRVSHLVLRQE